MLNLSGIEALYVTLICGYNFLRSSILYSHLLHNWLYYMIVSIFFDIGHERTDAELKMQGNSFKFKIFLLKTAEVSLCALKEKGLGYHVFVEVELFGEIRLVPNGSREPITKITKIQKAIVPSTKTLIALSLGNITSLSEISI